MKRKQLISEVGELLDTYCQDCFLRTHFRKEFGKNHAQTFCINSCTVGQKIREYGEKLSRR